MGHNYYVAPTHLMWPVLQAIKALGGVAGNDDIVAKVIELESADGTRHGVVTRYGSHSSLDYRIAWARTQLKHIHAIDGSRAGIWSITDFGKRMTASDVIVAYQHCCGKTSSSLSDMPHVLVQKFSHRRPQQDAPTEEPPVASRLEWKNRLLDILKSIPPQAFERLAQRLLRAAGFESVSITGRVGDNGIDGQGLLQINLITFSVAFQCKRYSDTVGPSVVRDFQGSIQGRHEKGIIITTGVFSKAATQAARRPGIISIDLIDGSRLCDLLAKYELGVRRGHGTSVEIAVDWFCAL